MEARLSAALAAGAETTIAYAPLPPEPAEIVAPGGEGPPVADRRFEKDEDHARHKPGVLSEGVPESESTNVWPDEAAEGAFIAEARGRGEPIAVAPETIAEVEDKGKALPKLDELVQRIPADARELIEELFRAKFTVVRRVKKTDLKG